MIATRFVRWLFSAVSDYEDLQMRYKTIENQVCYNYLIVREASFDNLHKIGYLS